MGTLTQFLKEQAAEQRAHFDAIQADVSAWQRSVNDLVGRMQTVLEKADEDHVLRTELRTHQLIEEGIGPYPINGLSIWLGARHVEVIPVARRVVARFDEGQAPARSAEGRVDMTNGEWKCLLYRFVAEPQDRWMMVDDRDYRMVLFDPSTFENAIQSLLA
jgi:hypothetical protein